MVSRGYKHVIFRFRNTKVNYPEFSLNTYDVTGAQRASAQVLRSKSIKLWSFPTPMTSLVLKRASVARSLRSKSMKLWTFPTPMTSLVLKEHQ